MEKVKELVIARTNSLNLTIILEDIHLKMKVRTKK
ncbi:hypothetical protein B6N60_03684 [Richelia sinica FACHB-800]|uniref:Uncharacterized protein n=1 Tax=Richelia sinica FACHB-800 TaxID=1357546 RepID=A0A975Y677_9NOST|nr:hypothetical protein B6N60_03684 [Richelia sinica FACHB-800]